MLLSFTCVDILVLAVETAASFCSTGLSLFLIPPLPPLYSAYFRQFLFSLFFIPCSRIMAVKDLYKRILNASGDVLYIPVYLFKPTASVVGGDSVVSQKCQNGHDHSFTTVRSVDCLPRKTNLFQCFRSPRCFRGRSSPGRFTHAPCSFSLLVPVTCRRVLLWLIQQKNVAAGVGGPILGY